MSFYKTYNWLMPSLAFNVVLIIGRVMYTGELTFAFLLWNVFLAVLPLYYTYRMQQETAPRVQWIYAALWLLFFPNAMYIVTDLFHLREREEIPLWYDLLLLLSAGLNGVVMGFVSLRSIERWLHGKLAARYIPFIIFALLLLCGYGIYLGRYMRWNSWDIVVQPFALFMNIGYHIIHPFRNAEVWLLSLLFGIWMYVLYAFIRRLQKA